MKNFRNILLITICVLSFDAYSQYEEVKIDATPELATELGFSVISTEQGKKKITGIIVNEATKYGDLNRAHLLIFDENDQIARIGLQRKRKEEVVYIEIILSTDETKKYALELTYLKEKNRTKIVFSDWRSHQIGGL